MTPTGGLGTEPVRRSPTTKVSPSSSSSRPVGRQARGGLLAAAALLERAALLTPDGAASCQPDLGRSQGETDCGCARVGTPAAFSRGVRAAIRAAQRAGRTVARQNCLRPAPRHGRGRTPAECRPATRTAFDPRLARDTPSRSAGGGRLGERSRRARVDPQGR